MRYIVALLTLLLLPETLRAQITEYTVQYSDRVERPQHCKSQARHCIEISVRNKELSYFKDGSLVAAYSAVTQSFNGVARGFVTKIETNPWWYPTRTLKKYYLQEFGISLPDAVPPRHQWNAMGTRKIVIDWQGSHDPLARIHGARHYPNNWTDPDGDFTFGCVRLLNPFIEELTSHLVPAEGIEVVLFG